MDLQHKSLEWGLIQREADKILELGSGKSDHIRFVKQPYSEYHETDLYLGALPKRTENSLIKQFELDATKLDSISNGEYDRIIVSCLLIHLDDMSGALTEWLRVLKAGGTLSLMMPCEPGAVLRFARLLSTRRKSIKSGFDYNATHYSEHKSYFLRAKYYIDELIDVADVKWWYFSLFLHSWNLNLWSVVQIKKK